MFQIPEGSIPVIKNGESAISCYHRDHTAELKSDKANRQHHSDPFDCREIPDMYYVYCLLHLQKPRAIRVQFVCPGRLASVPYFLTRAERIHRRQNMFVRGRPQGLTKIGNITTTDKYRRNIFRFHKNSSAHEIMPSNSQDT